ncbi:E-Cad/CTF3 like [Actinidia chinensis var. chinensis]|uniref:E-Cad/CTF3 like n=1 Tax=Actinidia chinensis var. chinensis TaxID=1590841 RepID=A0A2R6QUN9_ACTCC|nr:E-Cad/CTF3 like [Actinidia chinensis var. chinensis]
MPPNFTGLCLPLTLSHLNSLLLCGFLLSPHIHFCFVTHISLLLAGQLVGALALFTSHSLLLRNPHLPPPRWPIGRSLGPVHQRKIERFAAEIAPRPVRSEVTGEIGMRDLDGHVCDANAMFVMQFGALIMTCAVHSCWVREYEGLEAERERGEREEEESEDCEGTRRVHGECGKNS